MREPVTCQGMAHKKSAYGNPIPVDTFLSISVTSLFKISNL